MLTGVMRTTCCLILAGLVGVPATNAQGKVQPHIRPGATAYIQPADGFENYLAAAFVKERVPLTIVTDKAKAEYIVTSAISREERGITSTSISVVESNTSQVVFAYSYGRNGYAIQPEQGADGCAKHLRQFIEKPEK